MEANVITLKFGRLVKCVDLQLHTLKRHWNWPARKKNAYRKRHKRPCMAA